jgi:hypothetical protein
LDPQFLGQPLQILDRDLLDGGADKLYKYDFIEIRDRLAASEAVAHSPQPL